MDGSTDNFFEYNGKFEISVSINGRFQQEITIEQLYQMFAERLKAELATPKLTKSKTGSGG